MFTIQEALRELSSIDLNEKLDDKNEQEKNKLKLSLKISLI